MTDKFSGRDFLENRLEYYIECEGDDIRAFIKKYRKHTLDKLLNVLKLHKVQDTKEYDKEGLKAHNMEIEIIQIMIAAELNIPTVGGVWYLVDMIEEFRQAHSKELAEMREDLTKLNRHKHLTFGAGYSEKPVW